MVADLRCAFLIIEAHPVGLKRLLDSAMLDHDRITFKYCGGIS